MHYYVFDGEITPKSVKDFIAEVEATRTRPTIDPPETGEDGESYFNIPVIKLTIYINTNGGYVGTAYLMSDYLKRLVTEQFCEIDIFVPEFCHSAGIFFLFDLYEFSKEIDRENAVNFYLLEHSEFLLHEIAADVNTRQNDKTLNKNIDKIKKRRERLINTFKPFLDKNEIADLKKSNDIVIDCERMAKMIEATIIETL